MKNDVIIGLALLIFMFIMWVHINWQLYGIDKKLDKQEKLLKLIANQFYGKTGKTVIEEELKD